MKGLLIDVHQLVYHVRPVEIGKITTRLSNFQIGKINHSSAAQSHFLEVNHVVNVTVHVSHHGGKTTSRTI